MSDEIGILSPNGILTPCESFGHTALAYDIVSKMQNVPPEAKTNGVKAEDWLKKQGYLIVRARDIISFIGYPDPETWRIRLLTDEQKNWLIAHYESANDDKRRSIDKIIDRSRE